VYQHATAENISCIIAAGIRTKQSTVCARYMLLSYTRFTIIEFIRNLVTPFQLQGGTFASFYFNVLIQPFFKHNSTLRYSLQLIEGMRVNQSSSTTCWLIHSQLRLGI
jgi:hypothetical protein